ncbi:MAG: YdcF family protein [Oscillospiraceae bacterium]|jgi:uncharacterized SAM-binding protein YcdF (DUF218 family)|nr:YdcF family protein [Oscillospiraceae bacterium]
MSKKKHKKNKKKTTNTPNRNKKPLTYKAKSRKASVKSKQSRTKAKAFLKKIPYAEIAKFLVILGCLLLIAFGLISLIFFTPIVTFSTLIAPILFLAIGTLPIITIFCWKGIKKLCKRSKAIRFSAFGVAGVYIAGLIFCLVMLCVLFSAQQVKELPANLPVIILGGYVKNDSPSIELGERLNAAVPYLKANPDSICIVTGGLQPDAQRTQAAVMKEYLERRGIASERIIEESLAYDTDENMQFSKEILDERNLGKDIVLVTSEYHQYRSQQRAKKHGLEPYPISSKTSIIATLPRSYMREILGVIELWMGK